MTPAARQEFAPGFLKLIRADPPSWPGQRTGRTGLGLTSPPVDPAGDLELCLCPFRQALQSTVTPRAPAAEDPMAQTYTIDEAAGRLGIPLEEFKRRWKTEWTTVR